MPPVAYLAVFNYVLLSAFQVTLLIRGRMEVTHFGMAQILMGSSIAVLLAAGGYITKEAAAWTTAAVILVTFALTLLGLRRSLRRRDGRL